MIGLTAKQAQLLRYLQGYMSGPGSVAPTFNEMRAAMGIVSKSGIHRLLDALVERGYVNRIPGRARAIELIDPNERQRNLAQALALASDEQLQAELDRRAMIRRSA